jgi:hypothetical protein
MPVMADARALERMVAVMRDRMGMEMPCSSVATDRIEAFTQTIYDIVNHDTAPPIISVGTDDPRLGNGTMWFEFGITSKRLFVGP